MLSTLEANLEKAIKKELGFKKEDKKVPKFKPSEDGLLFTSDGETTIKSEGEPLPEMIIKGIAKAVATEVIKALKSGINIEGMISDLSCMHSGSLMGAGGGVPGPVTILSGAIKSSAGKITISMGKIT